MYMMNDREFSNRKETLHGEFYENALKYPERIALIYENEKVSYKMLRLYALRAANYMWQRGVRRNDKIVVILPRGIGQVAALLGILAIGAAYVPIAMKQPLGRRKKIIENVKPALVLQDEAFLEENPWTGCIENNSKDTAYIIYTSGSSGEPKGVEMSHVAAMNTIEEILHMWNIGAEDSVLNISAFDFDLSVFDIFGLLTVGGTIVLIDEDDFRDPEVWKNLIEIYGITIWNSAPALLDMFLIMGENNHFGKLRLALVSGDWIPLYLPEKWYKVTSANSQFVALGGATEGGIWSNYYCVSKVDRLWNSIPYGQALPKQKYRITDENFVECGVDIPGELQIGGGSLAKGYINDEELTMKKFITDVKGERWYRTGDRGRRWADGTIEFLGRMDTQVKIRGHRIELGEIESVLKSISRIKEAVVVAQGDKYHKELVAFYLGEYIAESEIEDYLKIHLPEYSIPNSINRLENFPLNANGKVDRRRLAEYQKTDSVEIMSDKVLNIVLMIWEELLKNKVADLDENLFKIGADSLLAARFVAAINARCGIEVRMKEVFMNPSINALTKLVDKRKNTDPLHLYHRIELTFSTGRLCLVNTHGPVIWLPFLHMPRDEYGTLSINVEEEVNIPSGVTIGNVMLPSVKETFEQIWPDAVKKALEILFKQNRTEKMSMAQYQIYVSKLWSEICQKVGYMNIVDYDNFGDIKSIFYDLEKRHLIKKENDGIE